MSGDVRVRKDGLLEVPLTKGGTDLAHVPRIGTDHHALTPTKASRGDERIEGIYCQAPLPRSSEALLEAVEEGIVYIMDALGEGQPEIEDPGSFITLGTDILVVVFE